MKLEQDSWVDEAMEMFDDDYNISTIIEHEWEYIYDEEEEDFELFTDL